MSAGGGDTGGVLRGGQGAGLGQGCPLVAIHAARALCNAPPGLAWCMEALACWISPSPLWPTLASAHAPTGPTVTPVKDDTGTVVKIVGVQVGCIVHLLGGVMPAVVGTGSAVWQ